MAVAEKCFGFLFGPVVVFVNIANDVGSICVQTSKFLGQAVSAHEPQEVGKVQVGPAANSIADPILDAGSDVFADALQDQFGFTAFSATGMAAPAFAAAAAGVEMTRPLTIEGETLSLARLTVSADSVLTRYTAGELETHYNLSVVLLRRNHESDLHPPGNTQLLPGDALAVLGGPAEISLLCRDNHT